VDVVRLPALRERGDDIALLITAFLTAFCNVQHGLNGQLVRPIQSQFDPTYRDYLSNIYRQAENVNLQQSFQTNKLIGMGFGMPFLTVLAQADISNIYPLWNYIPHNTLLWIGMRMGAVGNAAFWGLVAMAVLQAWHGPADGDHPVAAAPGKIVRELPASSAAPACRATRRASAAARAPTGRPITIASAAS